MLSISQKRAILTEEGFSSGHWFQLHLCNTANYNERVKADIPIVFENKLSHSSNWELLLDEFSATQQGALDYLKQYNVFF